jgi:hypothetical protein
MFSRIILRVYQLICGKQASGRPLGRANSGINGYMMVSCVKRTRTRVSYIVSNYHTINSHSIYACYYENDSSQKRTS